jgi:hypothetical protein
MSEHAINAVLHTALLGFFNDLTTSCITATLTKDTQDINSNQQKKQIIEICLAYKPISTEKLIRYVHKCFSSSHNLKKKK